MYTTVFLVMAAAALAVPTPQSGSAIGAVPPKDQEFGLAMKVDGSYVSLNAVVNTTIGNAVLQGQRLSVYPGTPAYFNGTGEYKALNFDIDGQVWGAGVPDVGDNYGYAASAYAIFGFQQFEWSVNNGKISHKLQAALNSFYACKDHVGDEPENYYLKWGTEQSNGQAPVGCQYTEVIWNNNMGAE